MQLSEFRATRRNLTIAQAQSEFDYMSDLDFSDYDGILVYQGGAYILQSRKGYYLEIEGDEYLTRDLALLEFILWQWACVNDDGSNSHIAQMIWG